MLLSCVLALALLGLVGAGTALRADTPRLRLDDDLDASAARAAMLRGQILPLEQILARLRPVFPGEIIAIELEKDDGRLIYEIDLLSPEGRLVSLDIDAASGAVLDWEAKDDDHD